jgi:hypothetical protein
MTPSIAFAVRVICRHGIKPTSGGGGWDLRTHTLLPLPLTVAAESSEDMATDGVQM